ncbi:MAG: hypothetical protein HOO93_04495 [Methyloglobulus sp.]|nr:hypothetical protein [Methyloglobulus sp.]
MVTLFKKTALASSILLLSAGFAGVASAHCFNANNSQPLKLGSATNTHDLYRVQCFNNGAGDADRVEAAVQKQSANFSGFGVRVQIAREGYTPSAIVSDTGYASGDSLDLEGEFGEECSVVPGSTSASPFAVLQPHLQAGTPNEAADAGNANGDYNILVDKTNAHVFSQNYGMIFHCLAADGAETGTAQVVANGRTPELFGNDEFGPADETDIDLLIDQ